MFIEATRMRKARACQCAQACARTPSPEGAVGGDAASVDAAARSVRDFEAAKQPRPNLCRRQSVL